MGLMGVIIIIAQKEGKDFFSLGTVQYSIVVIIYKIVSSTKLQYKISFKYVCMYLLN